MRHNRRMLGQVEQLTSEGKAEHGDEDRKVGQKGNVHVPGLPPVVALGLQKVKGADCTEKKKPGAVASGAVPQERRRRIGGLRNALPPLSSE